MNRLVVGLLRFILFPLLRWTTRIGGERSWRVWELATKALAGPIGRLARWIRPSAEPTITGIMQLVDQTDGLAGIIGEWELVEPTQAVKRITQCPLADALQDIPAFCTRLGVAMGEGAFCAYAPHTPFTYIIPRTLSQGNSCCEYVLTISAANDSVE